MTNEDLSDKLQKERKGLIRRLRKEMPALVIGDERQGASTYKLMKEIYKEQNEQGRFCLHVSRLRAQNRHQKAVESVWNGEMRRRIEMSTKAEVIVSNKFRFMTNCPCISKCLMTRRGKKIEAKTDATMDDKPKTMKKAQTVKFEANDMEVDAFTQPGGMVRVPEGDVQCSPTRYSRTTPLE